MPLSCSLSHYSISHFPSLHHCNSCNLLKEAPFTACHSHADPQPYITACSSTLCKYPAVDGLDCQFLEAYVRGCSLYTSNTPKGWRTKAKCCKTVLQCTEKTNYLHNTTPLKQDINKNRILCDPERLFLSVIQFSASLWE